MHIPSPDALDCLLGFLNDGRYRRVLMDDAERMELVTLADDWMAANGHWGMFLEKRLKARRGVNDLTSGTFNIPGTGDRPVIVTYPDTPSHAKGVFLQFVLHPNQGCLYRCLLKPCNRFLLRKSAHKSVYCGKQCARSDTARTAMKKGREEKQHEQAAKVNAALKRYAHSRSRADWRIYAQTETGLTQWTINTILKHKLIQEPKERKSAK